MSHELRTPLNSTLILAKLLADNKDGNLTAEQVKFAQTISSAGNDLLALINDILDLSKIEAGKVEVVARAGRPGARWSTRWRKTFEPLARAEEARASRRTIEPGAPRAHRDRRRSGSARSCKNLLSNALKFTEQGEVALRVCAAAERPAVASPCATPASASPRAAARHHLRGLPPGRRQHPPQVRRHRAGPVDLARPGAAARRRHRASQSAPGEGSTFTLTLPRRATRPACRAPHRARRDACREPTAAAGAAATAAASAPAPAHRRRPRAGSRSIDDDRDAAAPPTPRLILVDRGRRALRRRSCATWRTSSDFQCVVTHTRRRRPGGRAAAYRPSAILLDMNLPDHSGLGVLDQLKRNPQTRHIPVHVVSVADYIAARRSSCGAVGYALKPVKREQLVEALQRLEAKFSQGLRRVLVVEDDARQRESIRAAARQRRRRDHRRGQRRPRRSTQLQRDDLRLHGDGPEPARPERLRAARDRWPRRTTSRSRR